MTRLSRQPVELDRTFIEVRADQAMIADIWESRWFRQRLGMSWSDLLERPRVVILAEASSGKTYEFEARVKALRDGGKFAFFAPIEQLAESNLKTILGMNARSFEAWLASGETGWFFLDSVDEAKLTHRNFELGLNRFAADLGAGYPRARIYVSCRGTDWRGEADLQQISEALPALAPPEAAPEAPDDALLGRLKGRSTTKKSETPPVYSVVSMAALDREQRRRFCEAQGTPDVEALEQALERRGLTELASRPGDLLTYADHWTANHRLGSLTEMMEVSIACRIVEDEDRPNADLITDRQAREGAERIAAAMVLGRAMTVKKDPSSPGSGVNLRAILDDWTPAQQEALTLRGVFAPATFEQTRFNHRTTMEYLAAQWFARLLKGVCPASRAMAALTAKPFGVDTLAPSLRRMAAWLAPEFPELKQFLLKHVPLALMHYGDPAALPVADRARLLARYAELLRQGQVGAEYADLHVLWMFADKGLIPTIRAVWSSAEDNFRFELLRLIELGEMNECGDLAAETALDASAGSNTRILATQILARFGARAAMRKLAGALIADPTAYPARLGPQLAAPLFPTAMSLDALLTLMDQSPPAHRYQTEGFGYALTALYAACPSAAMKRRFIEGVAALCTQPPLSNNGWASLSARHAPIAGSAPDLVEAILNDLQAVGVWPGLIKLLWIAQVAEYAHGDDCHAAIAKTVMAATVLNEQLYWFGVEQAASPDREHNPLLASRWQRLRRQYWTISETDRPWLEAAALKAPTEQRRRIAFAALYDLSQRPDAAPNAVEVLRTRFQADDRLMADLDIMLNPPPDPPELIEMNERHAAYARAEAEREAQNHQSWRALRERLVANPATLTDEASFSNWPGYGDLVSLMKWLTLNGQGDEAKAALSYRDLAGAFSPEIADAYRTALMRFWRVTPPRSPKRLDNGHISRSWAGILALAGLSLEAATTPQWANKLTLDEAKRAIGHAFRTGLDFPPWLDVLLLRFPLLAEPPLIRELKIEWARQEPASTPLLYRASVDLPLSPQVERVLLKLVEGASGARLDDATRILRRLPPSAQRRKSLIRRMLDNLEEAKRRDDWNEAIRLIVVLFALDPPAAATALKALFASQSPKVVRERTEGAIGALFGMSQTLVHGFRSFSEEVVADLLRLAYQYVRPEDDPPHKEGSYSPDRRDDAQTARNELLGAVINKTSEHAYLLMRQLLADEAFGTSTKRLHRLAVGMAERGGEGAPWSEAAVKQFEAEAIEPVTSGERLFALVGELIDDIAHSQQADDVSARAALVAAPDEYAVQSWLASELLKLSKGRFTVSIEPEAVGHDRLDLNVTSTAIDAQVAIELKHGVMKRNYPELKAALQTQLAERYLKPKNRRHGIFIVSNHAPRTWSDGAGGALSYSALIKRLEADAQALTANRFGSIHVTARPLDFVLPEKAKQRAKGAGTVKSASAPRSRRKRNP